MAFPPWLCLNCSTRVLVSASPRWMDGCQHDSVTHSPSLCFALFGCILTYSLLLLRLIRLSATLTPSFPVAFSDLAVLVFVCHCFSRCLFPFLLPPCVCFLFFFSFTFPLVALFPSPAQSIVCQSNMWQVVRGISKSEEREKKKSTLTKAPSPELACSCKKKKYINYLHD